MLLNFLLFAPLFLLIGPRQIYPWLLAICIPTYAWFLWAIGRPLPWSDNWGELNSAFGAALILLAPLACGIRGIVAFVSKDATAKPIDWRPFQLSCAVTVLWGMGWLLAPAVARIVGVRALFLVSTLFVVAFWADSMRMPKSFRRQVVQTQCCSAAIGMIAVSIWPPAVVADARRIADGKAYCLVVADGQSSYRAASSWFDLMPLIMLASEDGLRARNNHGQLRLANGRWYKWSYRKGGFDKGADRPNRATPQNSCQPSVDFADGLSVW